MATELEVRPVSSVAPVVPVLAGCLALGALSLVLVPSTITYDPLSWATWAREIVHLNLDTTGGPSWKPLPILLDVVLAPFGAVEKWVWLAVARAGTLLGIAMVYRLARRLAGRGAALVAAGGYSISATLIEYLAPLGMSEPLLAGLALLAIERHLDGRPAQAYGLIYACLLLRPEAFPFFLGYSAFLWLRSLRARPWVVVLTVLLPVFWLLPDYLATGNPLRSSERASLPTQGGPLLSGFPAWAVIESGFNAVVLPVVVGAVIAMALATVAYLRRREDRVVFGLSALCLGWLLVVAVETQAHLGSGDQRYTIVAYALACVLAGVGWVRFVQWASARLSALARRRVGGAGRSGGAAGRSAATAGRSAATAGRSDGAAGRPAAAAGSAVSRGGVGGVAGWAVALVTAVVVVASAPAVASRLKELSGDIGEVPYQADKYGQLAALINEVGGRRAILACGRVTVDDYQMPAVAWDLDVHQSRIVTIPFLEKVATSGTVFRTRTTRGSPVVPPQSASPDFRVVATTAQWQLLSTCDALRG